MRTIILLGLVSFFTDVSSEMVYPLIPLYLTSKLGASPAILGIIEGIAESLASLLKVFSGYWSDKIDRRKPLTISGYSFSGLGKVLLVFSSSWLWVFGGRILDRFGKGIRTAPRDALIAQASRREKYGGAFGLHRALDTLGAVVGVLIAYYLFSSYLKSYETVFILSLIPAFIGIGLLFLVREVKSEKNTIRKPLNLSWSALDPSLKKFLIIIFLFALGNSSNQFLLLRAQDYGFDPARVILLYLLYNVVYALFSYPAGRLSDLIGRKIVLVTGYLFYGLIYFGFALATKPSHFWLLFGFYGIYAAFSEGVEKAFVADLAPESQRATLMGLYATITGIGLLPASILAGYLWKAFGARAPFFCGAALGILAAFGLIIALRNNDTRKTYPEDI